MGGRFCSFDQMHSECEWSLVEIMTQGVLLSLISSENKKKKKGLHRELKDIYTLNRLKTRKNKSLYRNLALYSTGTDGIYSC